MRRSFGVATALLLTGGLCVGIPAGNGVGKSGPGASPGLDVLSQSVQRVESVRDVKTVQRTYAQLAQAGRFEEMAALFASDSRLQWGEEVATGRAAIQAWLEADAGDMDGVRPGSLHFDMLDDPVVSLAPDGRSAQGRWDGLRFMGDGDGATRIDGGIYENDYVLEDGQWKIANLRYHRQLEGDYANGWTNADNALLPVVPYHFTPDSVGVPIPPASEPAPKARASVKEVAARIQALNDEDDVRNLQNSMGYYVDRRMWDDVVDLFAADSTYRVAGTGTFRGASGVRQALEQTMGQEGLTQFVLNDHPIWDLTVDIARDGRTATARGLQLGMLGDEQQNASWSFAVFRNTFIKEGGLWKLQNVDLTPILTADWANGWGSGGTSPATSPTPPPFLTTDRATQNATGAPPAITDLTRRLARSQAYDGAENVANSYSMFLNDLDFAKIGATFPEYGFKESPFIGFYRGGQRIADVGGRYGPPPTIRSSVAVHRNPQPVILVSHDGRSAQVKARLLQYGTSRTPSRGISGGNYLNQYVLEDGIWRSWDVTIDEFYWQSSMARSWSQAIPRDPSAPPPPPNPTLTTLPPDLALRDMGERERGFQGGTLPYIAWPDILPMWFNYTNLVSGRVPENFQDDCTPCGVKPSWSMLQFGYQRPPDGPSIDGLPVSR